MNTIPLKKKRIKNISKKRIIEIKRLKEEAKNNKDELLDGKTKIFKLLTDLEYEKKDVLHNSVVLELKLIKLEISPERIDRIENSVLSS